MVGLPLFDESIDMSRKLTKLRHAPCDYEIVEVRECPNMLPNRCIGRVLLIQRLNVTLNLRPQPQSSDPIDCLERSIVMFQHDNHLSTKMKEMSYCPWPVVMCPDPRQQSLFYAGCASFGNIKNRDT